MKTKTKIIIALAIACAGTLVLGACGEDSPYPDYAEKGFTVSVRYDTNGGVALGKQHVNFVDTFHIDDVKRGIKLLAPDDQRRAASGGAWTPNIERSGYFLAGWYAGRDYRTDEEGRALNEVGESAEVPYNGSNSDETDQGWVYSDLWNFEEDVLQLDEFEYSEGEVALTLYAAWVPEFKYEIYGKVADEETGVPDWEVIAEYSYNPLLSGEEDKKIDLPAWGEDGSLDYGNRIALVSRFREQKTFVKAYEDPEMTREVTTFENRGTWDPETGVSTQSIARYYAEWDEGMWFHIKTPEQLVEHAGANYSYEIDADLDFGTLGEDGKPINRWPTAFSANTYTGTIRGNGHTITGVTVTQTDASNLRYGLFGTVGAGAKIERLKFTNVEFRLEGASTKTGAMFGLFAGELSSNALLTDVEAEGKFVFVGKTENGNGAYIPGRRYDPITDTFGTRPEIYDLGLATGNLYTQGLTYRIVLEQEGEIAAELSVNETTGEIVLK